jgi:hypothetical protein
MSISLRVLAGLACLCLPALAAHAQQTALYRTGLLRDAASNPYQAVFDEDEDQKNAVGFLNISTFTQYTNSGGVLAGRYAFGELIDAKKRDKALGPTLTKGRSSLLNQNEFYTFQLRFRINQEKRGELFINNSTVTDTRVYLSNNLLRLLLYGNKNYVSTDLTKAFDMGVSILAYNNTAIGYRQDLNDQLSVGGSLNLYQGIINGRAVIDQTNFTTSPNGDSISLNYNGASDFSTGYNGDIKNMSKGGLKDFGRFANLGIGFSAGAEYRINKKFTVTGAIKDWGVIHWNRSGYSYSGFFVASQSLKG